MPGVLCVLAKKKHNCGLRSQTVVLMTAVVKEAVAVIITVAVKITALLRRQCV